ncbi:Spx/MgsR family RNA polymerase-binding regulatory protein [Candidatus Enterococcus ferrettii]|uniref:Regulatory protein spx n=1 Tax=Candidatus Enterococcus ferrettii TaxID=2815324 RepID=A0ABV0ES11_9ENTE|nr:Spx/MgsR family RNA polymerase-binding regulatory protein [Enterococcus sp. 665A]MBO1341344.1 transcriptional regulator Spx [Enterococcus sp. 665A]
MIHVLLGNSCTSCRKTRRWLQEYGIPYEERNIDHEPLSKEELKHILTLCDEGVDAIISTRSQIYQSLGIDFGELTFNQLLILLSQFPKLVKRPIIFDEQRLQVGFNDEEIRALLPKEVKKSTRNYLYKSNLKTLCGDILPIQNELQ